MLFPKSKYSVNILTLHFSTSGPHFCYAQPLGLLGLSMLYPKSKKMIFVLYDGDFYGCRFHYMLQLRWYQSGNLHSFVPSSDGFAKVGVDAWRREVFSGYQKEGTAERIKEEGIKGFYCKKFIFLNRLLTQFTSFRLKKGALKQLSRRRGVSDGESNGG